MIVPSMTKEEITKEILVDFAIVKRKSEYVIEKIKKEIFKSKKYPFIKAYDYIAPKTKNTWVYILEIRNKHDIFQTFVNYHYSDKGLMAGLVNNDLAVTFYTGHFFSRFVEREKLKIINPVEKIKEYFIQNPIISYEATELEDGAQEIIGTVSTGVVLGIKSKKGILVCNTYLSNEMLRKDQTLIAIGLKAEMDNYVEMEKKGLV